MKTEFVYVVRKTDGSEMPQEISWITQSVFPSAERAQSAIDSRRNLSEKERQLAESLSVYGCELRPIEI